MKSYTVLITEKAERDIIDIKRYISVDLHEPDIADRLIDRFREAMFGLSQLPSRYSFAADESLKRKGIHKLVVDNYIIFFRIYEEGSAVRILRVLYERRDWLNIL